MPPSSPGRSCRLQKILRIAAPCWSLSAGVGQNGSPHGSHAVDAVKDGGPCWSHVVDVVAQHGGALRSHTAEVVDDVKEGVPRESHPALLGFDEGLDLQILV